MNNHDKKYIFVNLPTWLGDAVMCSAALKALFAHFKDYHFVLFGSFVSCELFKDLQNVSIELENKKKRYLNYIKFAKKYKFDYAFSLRSAASARILLFLLRAKKRYVYNKYKHQDKHHVLRYIKFIEESLNIDIEDKELFLPFKKIKSDKKLLGISAGAKYGEAKRWEPSYFASSALSLKDTHTILLFGSKEELELNKSIEEELLKGGARVVNLCGKTSIKELCEHISSLDLLLCNDSGAMHIGAVYKIKTAAVFGPTNFTKTSPWLNENARLLHLNLPCMPCMKRICPLKHNACMRDLKPDFVISVLKDLV